MKKIILILFFVNFSYSQEHINIEVTYIKAYKNYKDSTNTAPRPLKNLEYKLICNSKESLFFYVKNMDIDLETNTNYIGRGGGEGICYSNLNEKLKLEAIDRWDQSFLVKSNFDEYEWKLSNETKYIGKYLCYKATTIYSFISGLTDKRVNIPITVWYTPDIPLSFGPAGYQGLPGLVLEKSASSFYFIATKVLITKNEDTKIIRPTKGKLITNKEYKKLLNERLKEMMKG